MGAGAAGAAGVGRRACGVRTHRVLAADGHAARPDATRGSLAIGESSVEGMGVNRSYWSGRRVLVTGHTGFKGGWLAAWLKRLGARVTGYALAPAEQPNLFEL